jgi:hypothetical protein
LVEFRTKLEGNIEGIAGTQPVTRMALLKTRV